MNKQTAANDPLVPAPPAPRDNFELAMLQELERKAQAGQLTMRDVAREISALQARRQPTKT